MKKILFIVCAVLAAFTQSAMAWTSYNYVSADELKGWLQASSPILLVDIQEKKDFAAHHIKASLETNAYPVESDHDRQTIDPAVKLAHANSYAAVVVVCPRGKGGAKRAYDYLAAKGVPEAKLRILAGGMENWPHKEWVVSR